MTNLLHKQTTNGLCEFNKYLSMNFTIQILKYLMKTQEFAKLFFVFEMNDVNNI